MAKVSERTIKARAERGLSGRDLTRPPKPGNFKITEEQARKIWGDIKLLVGAYPPKTVAITALVAQYNGVSETTVNNIRHGRSWNKVTGLPKVEYQ